MMRGDGMQKEELLHLHMLLFHLKRYFEGINNNEILTERYNSLKISPVQIHRDKHAHKDAVLTLGNEIVTHIHGRQVPVVIYTPDPALLPAAAGH
jgi:hypothetical protein